MIRIHFHKIYTVTTGPYPHRHRASTAQALNLYRVVKADGARAMQQLERPWRRSGSRGLDQKVKTCQDYEYLVGYNGI